MAGVRFLAATGGLFQQYHPIKNQKMRLRQARYVHSPATKYGGDHPVLASGYKNAWCSAASLWFSGTEPCCAVALRLIRWSGGGVRHVREGGLHGKSAFAASNLVAGDWHRDRLQG
jgi:hypothetical protein